MRFSGPFEPGASFPCVRCGTARFIETAHEFPAPTNTFDRFLLRLGRLRIGSPVPVAVGLVGEDDRTVVAGKDITELPVLVGVESLDEQMQLALGHRDRDLVERVHRRNLLELSAPPSTLFDHDVTLST